MKIYVSVTEFDISVVVSVWKTHFNEKTKKCHNRSKQVIKFGMGNNIFGLCKGDSNLLYFENLCARRIWFKPALSAHSFTPIYLSIQSLGCSYVFNRQT